MQDDINNKSVSLSIKATKLTGRLLAKAMQAFLKQARARGQLLPSPKAKHGMQSVRSLTKQGASISNIEITGNNIGDFKRVARKYNVDFSLKRDDSASPPKWLVFFKAKDADALMAAFKEYSTATLKFKERPNFLEKISQLRQKSKEMAAPAKNRSKGEIEL